SAQLIEGDGVADLRRHGDGLEAGRPAPAVEDDNDGTEGAAAGRLAASRVRARDHEIGERALESGDQVGVAALELAVLVGRGEAHLGRIPSLRLRSAGGQLLVLA